MHKVISKKKYSKKLKKLQRELVKLQSWIKHNKLKVIVIFEGRDAAGKGGTIKRITQELNHRVCRVAALPTPTEREKSQWYFQRFVSHFPAGGEMVLFDRSWYNRAGVEKVMGFCSQAEYLRFLDECPKFEKLIMDSGIILIKYWFSVSQKVQEERLKDRNEDITKRWKLGDIDIAAREKWDEYSMARDKMLKHTDTDFSPWYIVDANIKKHARINCISHLLSCFNYEDLTPEIRNLTEPSKDKYEDVAYRADRMVPDVAAKLVEEKDA